MQLPLFPPVVFIALVIFVCCLVCAAIGILLTRAKVKKKKFINTRIIIALSFAGIITLYFLFYAISNAVGRESVREMWGKIEAAGLTTKPESIIPKDPIYYRTDNNTTIYYDTSRISDNAVVLYKATIALIISSDIANKRFDLSWKNRKKQKKQSAVSFYRTPIYDVPNWLEKDRKKAIELSKNKDVQEALALFSRGNQKLYAVNLRYYTDIDADIQAILYRLNNYREIFRTISFVSECYAFEGKTNKAYDLILNGFSFIHKLQDDPLIISHLVYIACAYIDLKTLNSLVSRYGISSQKAQEVIEVLNQLNFNKSMQKGLHGDLVLCSRSYFKERMTGEKRYIHSGFDRSRILLDNICLYPFNYQEYAYYLKNWLKNYVLYDEPYWKVKLKSAKLNKEKKRLLSINNLTSYLGSYRLKTARMNSVTAATKVILALHIYKNKHGKFPERLDALVPDILKEIKVDPVSGKAYSYKKEGEYFKLTGFYSSKK